jgi:hypothetical protein
MLALEPLEISEMDRRKGKSIGREGISSDSEVRTWIQMVKPRDCNKEGPENHDNCLLLERETIFSPLSPLHGTNRILLPA